MKITITILFALGMLIVQAQQAQWRGPNRDGIYPETDLLKSWGETGPAKLLTIEGIGDGYSSAVEFENLIYVTGKIDSLDYLSAIDQSGKILWQTAYGAAWTKSYTASRCTPTIENNRVYVISGQGRLACIDAKTGGEIWAQEVDKQFAADYHLFGFAESPLIVDNLVISVPGGPKTTMVAFNKNTGELVWQSQPLNQKRSYAAPVLYEHKGIRQILAFTSKELISVNPANGELVWHYPYFKHSVEKGVEEIGINMTNTPIYKENEIFITSGYNCPSVMLTLAADGKSVSEKWVNPTFDCHHHGVVLVDGYLYGSNFYSNAKGKWVCADWNTGEIMYLTDYENKGAVIFADGMLYAYIDKTGTVALVEPTPKGFEPVSVFKMEAGKGPHWAHPSIYNGKLFIRHGEALEVFTLKM
ncbi:PQQ-binding-like beta-propeller repeat protein [Mangrovibacterium sp.]|uniref:PQQ-binding-like beta-propeller repeat protein n=1 Tax=Mangrovibacterium sp. TaxID=1961364 RepID=UPI0035643157